MSVWGRIREALAAGEDPVVELSYDQHLVPPAPKKRGRPKVQRLSTFSLYSSRPYGKHTRLRCMNPYCKKRLLTGQTAVCNEECRHLAIEHLQAALSLLTNQNVESLEVKDVPDVALYGTPRTAALPDGAGPTVATEGRRRGRRPASVAARQRRA